jgi:hypothetical protein
MTNPSKTPADLPTESDERTFWESYDSRDYVDWSAADRARLPNLRPSTKAISLRLP